MLELSVKANDEAVDRLTELCGTRGDRVERRLDVRRRVADDLEDVCRRRLALERLLGFVEEAHILDRNDRLVGEGLEQLDLPVGKRINVGSPNENRADRNP